ncbi:uncharacterized protein UV8b_07795 [Ustilaginoidea virens]|uniref:Cyanovirin-N domain-containing protein n=1 Tax=Ustilaginoidea virens TaxID=1159556 RepID=A0A8E5HXN8_USTVR|nr:uncharacterized protein UV8b_07795 [Ustilaginoidea virens]QUC23554.1 hypothetical protein UV8b_07795 [Ustilaginoidea virens]
MKITAGAAALAPALVLASPRAGLDARPDALSSRNSQAHEHSLASRDPNIINSCDPLTLDSTFFSTVVTQCANAKSYYRKTQIDLNNCIANFEGQLVKARHGEFYRSCYVYTCSLDGYMYSCMCRTSDRGAKTSSIDLSKVLYNYWGKLGC